MRKKILGSLFLGFACFLLFASTTKAACDPPECGDSNTESICTDDQTCSAKCCVDPDPGGGGATPPPGGGGQCNADYIRNCEGTRTDQISGSECVRIRAACKDGNTIAVGSAQSVGSCCEEWEVDGNLVCRSLTVYTHTCCPVGTEPSCRQESPPDSYAYLTRNDEAGAPGAQSFNCSPGWVVAIVATDSFRCNRYNEPNPDGKYTCTVYQATCRYPPTTLCDCVPTCTATAPSAVNFNSSNSNLTWNIGTNGTSQRLYVSKTQSDTTNNCAAGTNCTVNANLNSSTNLYPLAGLLDPLTIYYTKIVTYKDDTCSSSTNYSFTTPIANNPWWQVKDGDVTTDGNLTSRVPPGNVFLTNGLGGFPGIAIYSGTFNLSSTQSLISSTSWNANTNSSQSRLFNYNYFSSLIPDDVVFNNITNLAIGGTSYSDGYEWFKVNGNLSIDSDIDFGNRKVILFIENGDLSVNGRVNLNDGLGFFAVFVDGSININSSVSGSPALEGIYVANSNFQTGTTGTGDTRLHIRGSIATHGNFLLQRDLADNSTSAELFEYAPDQILLFPDKLSFKQTRWAEVAP